MSLYIGPETKVGALLEAYPEVQGILIEMAPAFAKLRNPVVRRTVAKVATLEHAASIGGVSLREMIRRIREFVGQNGAELAVAQAAQEECGEEAWLANAHVVEEVNADLMLERGIHPIGKIRETMGALRPGEAVVLHSSFRPQPLIETLRRAGAAVHCIAQGSAYSTYFGRKPG